MSSFLFVIAFAAATQPAPLPCDSSGFVSSSSQELAPSRFSDISLAMSVPEIVARIGPAAREIGSGLYILRWNVNDGRTFWVSAPSPCGRPISLGFHKREP